MALTDKPITVVAAQTVLSVVSLYPQPDGSVLCVATGATKDNAGNLVVLKDASLKALGLPVLDNVMARALSELRKANGLEV